MRDQPVTLEGYQLIEEIYNSPRTLIYRGISEADKKPVIIKLLHRDFPSFSELVRFRHQYTITKHLNLSGIVRPLHLHPYGNGLAMVMEDEGLIALKEFWKLENNSNFLAQFLTIAIQLANILDDLHQQRIIHKDINPANILVHPQSLQIKLIDFSIASQLPQEYIQLQPPTNLEGTLAYIAPEQTGRMNRGVDYRSDFYALGVTFYELLTGTLPFTSQDPAELVYSHLAKSPIPPQQINNSIPKILSNLILKLMSKNPEERYQTAFGLRYDLEKIQATEKEIKPFTLGAKDISDRFIISEKLYGRETEVKTLLAAFDRITQSQSFANIELMLVTGFSGIGKTVLVNEIHKPIYDKRATLLRENMSNCNEIFLFLL
ncbi:serine/threonine-protein kinase [Crocosphaera chwakensis]|uniref:Serine/Threonine protein kinase and Signal Transduction Histidine Kinase (STHK) with GAF sensor n=1 Tax=Crocosphaera chwakensis CCY0110 TaxID=391612 RepID=A3IRJ6_9CHRO|nr:serine/threonine-protein kinase [Crocosphaera chwakensis]EAZ90845.1 Serine/Threonine protein kinase and Signal Transduction Histidine Kinase (STHK) with GAF sensor [Crocosphaera chwakensis CCY0110]